LPGAAEADQLEGMNLFVKLALAAAITASAAGCAANACQRRAKYFSETCRGTGIVYNGDYLCETNLKNCNDAQKREFEAYVACLEANPVCSAENNARCAEQYPQGVNLQCISPQG
jgi:hypothetical protein